ncbi:MAG: hypothetical protein C0467_21090 [Planctomycetaceae bacterium]|nr:hypothetical protein [Planctomycetaceae bacterium]
MSPGVAFVCQKRGRSDDLQQIFNNDEGLHMRMASICPVAAVLLCLGGATVAQAGGSVWGYKGGEFRREANGKWVEYQGGKAAFSFIDTGTVGGAQLLHDPSRGITVKLTDKQAIVRSGLDVLLTYDGGWERQGWSYQDGKGSFKHTGAGKWTEYQNGKVAFTFKETARSANEVHLYDASRGITVKLTVTGAMVSSGPDYIFTIRGHWTE